MAKRDSGFSMLEVLVVMVVLGIITAMAIPQALTALRAYRLHADAAAVAAQMNVARFRATSQYAPYHVIINVAGSTFSMQRLCGNTPSTVDANCTGAYQSLSTPASDSVTYPLTTGDQLTTTNPGATCPPPQQPLAACAGTTDFYFNTRGMPVDNTGNPVANGGSAIYVQNQDKLSDAVVVTMGGRITTYNWDAPSSTWATR